nr:HD domain-containing protein [Pleionea sp. CnH1-48]
MQQLSLRVQEARAFAVQHHGEQRYGSRPYVYHLDQVASLLEPYGDDAQIIGYLHDIVEDTDVSLQTLGTRFGALIAECVDIVTDKPGRTRAERKELTYQMMAQVQGHHELALIVKAADRLANVKASVAAQRLDLMQTYYDESSAFKNAAYRKGLCDAYWQQLDDLYKQIERVLGVKTDG